jgi:hypothetical protein
MEDLGGIINVGVCIEVNLKDECPFELKEDIVLMVTTEPEWIDQSSVSAQKDKHKCIVKAMCSPHYKDEVALGLRQHS